MPHFVSALEFAGEDDDEDEVDGNDLLGKEEQPKRKRSHHHAKSIVSAQKNIESKTTPIEPIPDELFEPVKDVLPEDVGEKPDAPVPPQVDKELAQSSLGAIITAGDDDPLATLKGVVVGLAGWGVASGKRKVGKKRLASGELQQFGQPQARNWRWEQGSLQQEGKTNVTQWQKPLVQMATFKQKKS